MRVCTCLHVCAHMHTVSMGTCMPQHSSRLQRTFFRGLVSPPTSVGRNNNFFCCLFHYADSKCQLLGSNSGHQTCVISVFTSGVTFVALAFCFCERRSPDGADWLPISETFPSQAASSASPLLGSQVCPTRPVSTAKS